MKECQHSKPFLGQLLLGELSDENLDVIDLLLMNGGQRDELCEVQLVEVDDEQHLDDDARFCFVQDV